MTRTILTVLAGAAIGGLLGYSKVLCATGECQLTGSWQGGAAIGALLAFMVVGCPCSGAACRTGKRDADAAAPDGDAEAPAERDPDNRNPYRSG